MTAKNLGIEYYRILLTFMICVLHILGQGGALESTTAILDSKILWSLEVFCLAAVDGYALISGYNSKSTSITYNSIITMWLQVFCYSFGISLILYFIGFSGELEFKDILKTAFPLIENQFWYFSAYFPLFLLKPVINRCLNSLNRNEKNIYCS